MEKEKMNLKKLKVISFKTCINSFEAVTVQGEAGQPVTHNICIEWNTGVTGGCLHIVPFEVTGEACGSEHCPVSNKWFCLPTFYNFCG